MTEDQAKRLRCDDWVVRKDGWRGKVIYRDVAVCEIHWADGRLELVQHYNMADIEQEENYRG